MPPPRSPTPVPSGVSGIDGVTAWLLTRTFDHERVTPDSIPLPDDPDRVVLPAVAYRQLSGFRQDYHDRRASRLNTATYLVETFARDRLPCSQARDLLLRTFAGPCPADPRGFVPEDDTPWEPAQIGPLTVYSAEAGDPAADADFGFGELHERFAFVQVILTLTYLEG